MAGLIVHEWVAKSGGSERVVDEFAKSFPDAEIRVLWNDDPGRWPLAVRETWLARTPLRRSKALALPLMPATWRSMGSARQFDWMLVSSHLFAHHATVARQRHLPKLVYTHTPARYIWEPQLDSRGNSPLVRLASRTLRPLDRARAQEARAIAANSEFTRERIHRAWGRDSTVIYPPVNTESITAVRDWRALLNVEDRGLLDALPSEFVLGAARFVDYKRLDRVIDGGCWAGLPVVLAGSGPAERDLRERAQRANIPVHFVHHPSDALLYSLYQKATVYAFPAVEDFGIMPVEAMAAGAPVVAMAFGGAAESVGAVDGGITVQDWEPDEVIRAIERASSIDRSALRSRSAHFSNRRFRVEIERWVGTNT